MAASGGEESAAAVVGDGATTLEDPGAHGHARALTPRTVADADADLGTCPEPDDGLLNKRVRQIELAGEAGVAKVLARMTRQDRDDLVGDISHDAVVTVEVRHLMVVVHDDAARHDLQATDGTDRFGREDRHRVQATVGSPLRQHPYVPLTIVPNVVWVATTWPSTGERVGRAQGPFHPIGMPGRCHRHAACFA